MKKTINLNPNLQLNYEKTGKNTFGNIAVFENLSLGNAFKYTINRK